MKRWYVLLVGCLCAAFVLVHLAIAGPDDAERAAELNRKLAAVTRALEQVDDKIRDTNADHAKLQHDVMYENADLKVIYDRVKRLEKQLQDERDKLSLAFGELPRVQAIVDRRKALYLERRNLKDQELLIRNELKVVQ